MQARLEQEMKSVTCTDTFQYFGFAPHNWADNLAGSLARAVNSAIPAGPGVDAPKTCNQSAEPLRQAANEQEARAVSKTYAGDPGWLIAPIAEQ